MTYGVELTGVDEVKRRIADQRKIVPEALAGAVYLRGVHVLSGSVRLVPVDDGDLRKSNYLTRPTDVLQPSVEMGYVAPYAVFVHEILGVRHVVGQAKFLQIPFDLQAQTYLDDLAADVERLWNAKQGLSSIPALFPERGTFTASPEKAKRRAKFTEASSGKLDVKGFVSSEMQRMERRLKGAPPPPDTTPFGPRRRRR